MLTLFGVLTFVAWVALLGINAELTRIWKVPKADMPTKFAELYGFTKGKYVVFIWVAVAGNFLWYYFTILTDKSKAKVRYTISITYLILTGIFLGFWWALSPGFRPTYCRSIAWYDKYLTPQQQRSPYGARILCWVSIQYIMIVVIATCVVIWHFPGWGEYHQSAARKRTSSRYSTNNTAATSTNTNTNNPAAPYTARTSNSTPLTTTQQHAHVAPPVASYYASSITSANPYDTYDHPSSYTAAAYGDTVPPYRSNSTQPPSVATSNHNLNRNNSRTSNASSTRNSTGSRTSTQNRLQKPGRSVSNPVPNQTSTQNHDANRGRRASNPITTLPTIPDTIFPTPYTNISKNCVYSNYTLADQYGTISQPGGLISAINARENDRQRMVNHDNVSYPSQLDTQGLGQSVSGPSNITELPATVPTQPVQPPPPPPQLLFDAHVLSRLLQPQAPQPRSFQVGKVIGTHTTDWYDYGRFD